MSYIAVENLNQGMILEEDVRDINSRLLLRKGQKISTQHLRILKIWGICEVSVIGAVEEASNGRSDLDPEKLEHIKAAVDKVFQHLDTRHEAIQEIYQAALAYRYQHNLLSKPDPPPAPSSAAALQLNGMDVRHKIQKIDIQLPDAPVIITELNAVISDPLATSNDVAQVVNKSPSLTGLLLKIVNSAFYGFPSKIDRISRAVTIIGTKEISSLALGISVMQAFKDISPDLIDMPSFIRHSLACGLISRILAALKNIRDTEQVSISGLLHDIGKLIVLKYFPAAARGTFDLAAASGRSVYDCEKSILGIHHSQIGKHLLRKWKIPFDLENNVACHHSPSSAEAPIKAAILQMADVIVNAFSIGSSGEKAIPAFDDIAWDALDIPVQTIKTVIRQALHQLGAIEIALT